MPAIQEAWAHSQAFLSFAVNNPNFFSIHQAKWNFENICQKDVKRTVL